MQLQVLQIAGDVLERASWIAFGGTIVVLAIAVAFAAGVLWLVSELLPGGRWPLWR